MEEKHFRFGGFREEIATWQRGDPHDLDPTRPTEEAAEHLQPRQQPNGNALRVLQDAAKTISIYCQSEPRKSWNVVSSGCCPMT